jgi:hypothetical protein
MFLALLSELVFQKYMFLLKLGRTLTFFAHIALSAGSSAYGARGAPLFRTGSFWLTSPLSSWSWLSQLISFVNRIRWRSCRGYREQSPRTSCTGTPKVQVTQIPSASTSKLHLLLPDACINQLLPLRVRENGAVPETELEKGSAVGNLLLATHDACESQLIILQTPLHHATAFFIVVQPESGKCLLSKYKGLIVIKGWKI